MPGSMCTSLAQRFASENWRGSLRFILNRQQRRHLQRRLPSIFPKPGRVFQGTKGLMVGLVARSCCLPHCHYRCFHRLDQQLLCQLPGVRVVQVSELLGTFFTSSLHDTY